VRSSTTLYAPRTAALLLRVVPRRAAHFEYEPEPHLPPRKAPNMHTISNKHMMAWKDRRDFKQWEMPFDFKNCALGFAGLVLLPTFFYYATVAEQRKEDKAAYVAPIAYWASHPPGSRVPFQHFTDSGQGKPPPMSVHDP